MKKVFILLVSLLAMMSASLSVKAQDVTITLLPGWNWISYTNAEPMDIATAMGDFVPMEGDVLKSSYGFAEYSNGNWIGGLQQFTPGLGYMYCSNRTSTVSFVYVQTSSLFAVTTAEPTDITYYSATCGGTVTVAEDDHVFLRGVCWSTEPNPTVDDNHTTDEPGIGSWSVQVWGLPQGVTYYVRAYAVSDSGLKYGDDLSFTTLTIDYTDHDYVDLGLPNGTLWATCNVGATAPEGYGEYFAWGETYPKAYYDWGTYQYCNGNDNYNPQLTKYCSNESLGYNGFTDDLTTLLPEDDVATANWGTDWRMPTGEEWQELVDNTTITWTTQNGVNGMLFTAMNGNSLFLPDAGVRFEGNLNGGGCFYWSSSLYDNPTRAICGYSEGDSYYIECARRFLGYTVRAVRSVSQSTSFIIEATANPTEGGVVIGSGTYEEGAECELTAAANEGYVFVNWTENGEVVSTEATYSFIVTGNRHLVANFSVSSGDHAYVDLGLPSGTLWATCNVGANFPEDYGDYFAWGETQPKDTYDWSNYQYCNGDETTLTKYCSNSDYGFDGFIDNLSVLQLEDDAATANWGNDWRIPTKEEWQELYNNTTCTWTTQNDVNGMLFTATNGNNIFMPAAGSRLSGGPSYSGFTGIYWSSSLYTDAPSYSWDFYFFPDDFDMDFGSRNFGFSIRPVRSMSQTNAPTGAINGKFTINEEGNQVYFAQGNLQYIGSAVTPYWKFAESQWECLGTTTGQNSADHNVDRDLFGWGTSGWNSSNTCYHPWDTFSSTGSSYGPLGTNNLTGTYANADWGVYNSISNGGNQPNQWRTLTKDEWGYVFDTRITTSGIRFAKANVNDVNGIVLLPDDWNTNYFDLGDTNTNSANYSSNTITALEWKALEQHGAVFLPANGYRFGTSVYSVGNNGYYWSSSFFNATYAYGVYFQDSGLNPRDCSNRTYGRSVRLVCVAE